jgi:hypothetical protein
MWVGRGLMGMRINFDARLLFLGMASRNRDGKRDGTALITGMGWCSWSTTGMREGYGLFCTLSQKR